MSRLSRESEKEVRKSVKSGRREVKTALERHKLRKRKNSGALKIIPTPKQTSKLFRTLLTFCLPDFPDFRPPTYTSKAPDGQELLLNQL